MDLKELLNQKPSEMSDAELTDRINRLRTAKIDSKGKIVARTNKSRKYAKARKQLMLSGIYNEQTIDAVIAQMEIDDVQRTHESEQRKIPSLDPGETFLPKNLFPGA